MGDGVTGKWRHGNMSAASAGNSEVWLFLYSGFSILFYSPFAAAIAYKVQRKGLAKAI